MSVREYRRVTDSTLVRLAEKSQPRLSAWTRRWFGEGVSVGEVRWIRLLSIVSPQKLVNIEIDGKCRACVADDPDLFDRLVQRMLSLSDPTKHSQRESYQSWARAVSLEAIADLVTGLFEGFKESESPLRDLPWRETTALPAEFSLPGAGALTLGFTVDGTPLFLHVDGSLVNALAPASRTMPSTRTVPLSGRIGPAISGESIRLAATTAITTVPLDSLQGLSAGDVVVLDHLIEDPLMIRTSLGVSAGTAYLGTTQGRRAVRVST